MSRMIDLTGKQFGWLTVLHRSDKVSSSLHGRANAFVGNL